MKALFIVVFGLWPLVAAVLAVILADDGSNPNYWAAAPWIIIASLPITALTTGLAVVALNVWSKGRSSLTQQLLAAARAYILALIAIALAVFLLHFIRH